MLTKQEEIEQFFENHSWLMGDNFIKRSLAIYGYALMAFVMLYGVFLVAAMLLFAMIEMIA